MPPLLRVENASFGFDTQNIFSDLNFAVNAGETLCILGANGCGKTTMLRSISGALKLRTGKIYLDDKDISTLGPSELAQIMGFVFQEHSAPFPFPVIDVVRMGRAPYLGFLATPGSGDDKIAEQAMETVGISHLREKPYTQISGGERQLVLIARTLAQQPKIILFDEPTSHLDFKNQALILNIVHMLSEQGIAVVMTTHMPNHALMFPSRVALMSKGKMIAIGDAVEILKEANLKATYDIDVRVLSARDPEYDQTHTFCVPLVGQNHTKPPEKTLIGQA